MVAYLVRRLRPGRLPVQRYILLETCPKPLANLLPQAASRLSIFGHSLLHL
jgi:hypothetical protein